MRVWIIKPEIERSYPDDVVCFEIGGGMIVFIQGDGQWDVCNSGDGLPTEEMWDAHGESIE